MEISICMAVLGVLTVPALLSMKELRERRRLHEVAAQVFGDLQFARSESVRNGSTIHISFVDSAGGSCYWLHAGEKNACSCDGGQVSCKATGELIRTHWQPRDSAIQIRANVGRMTFQGVQGTVTPAGNIELRASSGTGMRHIVNIMGRVRSCSPDTDRGSLPPC